jgi:hypothetical protein
MADKTVEYSKDLKFGSGGSAGVVVVWKIIQHLMQFHLYSPGSHYMMSLIHEYQM